MCRRSFVCMYIMYTYKFVKHLFRASENDVWCVFVVTIWTIRPGHTCKQPLACVMLTLCVHIIESIIIGKMILSFLPQTLRSVCWHHEGKQFICSHGDGSLTIWNCKTPAKPHSYLMPHGKQQKHWIASSGPANSSSVLWSDVDSDVTWYGFAKIAMSISVIWLIL